MENDTVEIVDVSRPNEMSEFQFPNRSRTGASIPFLVGQSQFRVRLLTDDEIPRAQELRFEVWRAEGIAVKCPETKKIACSHDRHSVHWGAFDEDLLIGSARLCIHATVEDAPDGYLFIHHQIPLPVASLNRLVLKKAYRGLGIGRALDQVRVEFARRARVRALLATAVNRESRILAFRKMGFQFLPGTQGTASWADNFAIYPCVRIFLSDEVPLQ
jgi:GNAT superfamily N-acetyltransferase